jgi:hypothetical protein
VSKNTLGNLDVFAITASFMRSPSQGFIRPHPSPKSVKKKLQISMLSMDLLLNMKQLVEWELEGKQKYPEKTRRSTRFSNTNPA